ncbi:MAG: lysophospholipid acyltransferase family protein [Candidatus Binatia bacterium]
MFELFLFVDKGKRLLIVALRIFGVALLTLFWSVPVILLSFLDSYGERGARLIRFWARGVLWLCRVKVQLHGRHRLDPGQAVLFMANHQSNFDIPIMMAAFDTLQVRWVSKREVRKVPVIGLCMQVTRQVLVDRDSPTQAITVIRQVKKLLDAGISVVLFPEGTRTRDGRLQSFKPGGFAMAVATGAPVVPVTINGSRAIWPPGCLALRPGTVEVVFGEPIPVDAHLNKKAAREELAVKVHEAIATHLAPPSTPADTPLAVPTSTPERQASL